MSGWFDDILGSIRGSDVANVVGTVFAGQQAKNATEQAANTAIAANERAAQIAKQGQVEAQRRYAKIAEAGQPGVGYLQQVVAQNPYRLTPAQKNSLDDTRRELNARLSKSGLRGAGRSVAAVFNDVDNRTQARMLDANQQRQTAAAGTLAGQAIGAEGASANISNSGALQAANLAAASGDTAANAVKAGGVTDAQSIASILGSVMARDEPRSSRYERVTPKG